MAALLVMASPVKASRDETYVCEAKIVQLWHHHETTFTEVDAEGNELRVLPNRHFRQSETIKPLKDGSFLQRLGHLYYRGRKCTLADGERDSEILTIIPYEH
jgi:hypothetical protein